MAGFPDPRRYSVGKGFQVKILSTISFSEIFTKYVLEYLSL